MPRNLKFALLVLLIVFSFACSLISGSDWNGIPAMPNSTVDQQTKTSYSFKVNASSVEVMTFYKDKLTALGWTVVGETSAPVIAAKKNTSTIEITTFNNVPNGVSVLIIYHP